LNDLIIFDNPAFGKVRTLLIDGNPWFVGKDAAVILGYSNTSKALADHVDPEDKLNNESLSSLGQRGGWLINESGLYSLILSSHMPRAKQFKRWVTSEILPSIRKHGVYMIGSLMDQVMQNPQVIYQMAESLLKERNRADRLDAELQEAMPKAAYFDAFVNPRDCTNIRNTANELGIPQKEFVTWLLEKRVLYRDFNGQLLPYSTYLHRGCFIVRDYVRNGHQGVQTLFTPRGKDFVRRSAFDTGDLI